MVKKRLDPITLQVIRNGLTSIADEMAVAVVRTSYSELTRQYWDFSTGLADGLGNVVAQGLCAPIHMGSFPDALQSVLRAGANDIRPGDVFVMNDPYSGGMHLPDCYVMKPIFSDGELLGIAVAMNHFTEIGGRAAGGQAYDSDEIYQEGVRLTPLRLYEEGKPIDAIFKIIAANVRTPDITLGDLRALVGACHVAEQGLLQLTNSYGAATMKAYMDELLDYSEELARTEIRSWPKGTCSFVDYLDTDGVGSGPVKICVSITVQEDSIDVDFTGSDPQLRSALNSTLSSTKAMVYCALRGVMPGDIPTNSGFYRPISVHAPLGNVVNAAHPAAVGARGATAIRICDAMYGALSQILPDRVFAAGEGGPTGIIISGWDEDRRPIIFYDSVNGAWGGRPTKDGVDAISNPGGNLSNIPVEVVESRQPVMVTEYALAPDTGGAGKYRGGLSLIRSWRFIGDEARLMTRADRTKIAPWGLKGGRPGATNVFKVTYPDGREEVVPSRSMHTIMRDTLIWHRQAGAGGWGDPLERESWRVLDDVRTQKVTVVHAKEAYGVVIGMPSLTVNEQATKRLRASRKRRLTQAHRAREEQA